MTQGLEHVQELEIVRWDVVSYDNITKNPMIYVKPTEKFLTSARHSEFLFHCVVSDSGSKYDNVAIVGVVRPSAVVPNCRPNFYAATGLYTITLLTPWLGYPEHMGHVNLI